MGYLSRLEELNSKNFNELSSLEKEELERLETAIQHISKLLEEGNLSPASEEYYLRILCPF